MKLLRFARPISSVSVACERLHILLEYERNLVSQADLIRMTQTANGGQPRTIASAWNSSPEAVALVDAHQHLWWYHSAHAGQVGPLTVQELKDQLATNPDARRLFVWRDGMSEWRRAGDVRELHSRPARSSNIAAELEAPLRPAMSEMSRETAVNLRKLEERLTRKPIDEIAILVQGLTYGEMIELAQAMWKAQPEGSAVTQENLPVLLHCWSESHSAWKAQPEGSAVTQENLPVLLHCRSESHSANA
jgi:hypothetical protein